MASSIRDKVLQRLPWKSGRHSSANSHTPQAKTTPNVSLTASSRGEPETQDLITNIEPHGPAVHATLEADHPPPITSPPLQPVVPATHLPPPQIITNAVELSGLPGRLWTQAYDAIWTDEPELAKSYEAILRGELGDESSLANNEEGNHRTDATQAQMERLVKVGLERTKREAAVKHKIHEGMRVVSSVKDLVGTALKQAPEAAPAWAGICLLLQVLENPTAEAGAHRDGVSYVISRMDWYWNLSTILLENQSMADGLRAALEEHVVTLYKKLLSYQMKSVCSFSRKRAAVVWRDMFRFDNWTDAVRSIKDAETVVQRDIDTYNNLVVRTTLSSMAELAKDRNMQLQDIHQAIQESAQIREDRQQDEQNRKCLQDLRLSDPRVDRQRIEVTKGGLFRGASNWILDHDDFRQWYHCDDTRLLWVKGDPGKGKTMLLLAIVEELEQQPAQPEQQQSSRDGVLTYFFCQGTNKDLNTATAVLRGLIYLLAVQNPTLIPRLRESYDHTGADLFKDANSFFALSRVLESMLYDESVTRAYIVIDALDECMTDREMLLKLVSNYAASSPHLKWIVSSRNRPEIEQHLKLDNSSMKLSLELMQNADQVSEAVDAYIDFKISELQSLQSDHEQRNRVRAILREKANGTFLWVALVAKGLEKARGWRVMQVVEKVPAGLDELYGEMMQQIRQQEEDWELCQRVLSAATLAYRPLHLAELAVLSGLPKDILANMEYVREIVALCGSFLTIQDDNFAYIIHQSAKDYLSDRAAAAVFPAGHAEIHCDMLLRSLEYMQERLKRNIYGMHHPGFTIDSLEAPDPDPLAAIRYSCVHWVDHLYDGYDSSRPKEQVDLYGEPVLRFLQKSSLYWLEALGLIQHIGDGVLSMIYLENLLKEHSFNRQLVDLVQDLRRFILQNRWVIENTPLQTYESALIFTPTDSLLRKIFKNEEPKWIKLKPIVERNWSSCQQTLEGYGGLVQSVTFSHNSNLLASGSRDGTVNIWDTATGALQQTLEGHDDWVWSIAFSHDSKLLASGAGDKTIKIWNIETGALQQILGGYIGSVWSIAFSHDSKLLASGSEEEAIKIWDIGTGALQQILDEYGDWASSVAFSHDSKLLASGLDGEKVKIWDTATWALQQTLDSSSADSIAFSHDSKLLASGLVGEKVKIWDTAIGALRQTLDSSSADSIAFSHDSKLLASGSANKTIRIWDLVTGVCQQILEGHGGSPNSIAFSHDSKLLASGSVNKTIRIWDLVTGVCQQILEGHGGSVNSVAFSHDSKLLASGSNDGTTKLWDIGARALQQAVEGHGSSVKSVALSYDSKLLASGSDDETIRIWDTATGISQHTLKSYGGPIESITFSYDAKLLASSSDDGIIQIWDTATGVLLQTFEECYSLNCFVIFSYDAKLLASGLYGTIRIWDTATGVLQQTLKTQGNSVKSFAFSRDGKLASYSDGGTIQIWDTATGILQQPLEGCRGSVESIAFSYDSRLLASSLDDETIQIWDTATGVLQQILDIGARTKNLSFDDSGSYLNTSIGCFTIANRTTASSPVPIKAKRHGYGLSLDKSWITWNEHNVLWLPPDWRPGTSAISSFVSQSTTPIVWIALGCSTGRVAVIGAVGSGPYSML